MDENDETSRSNRTAYVLQIAFLAGLLEGEACFSYLQGKRAVLRIDFYTTDKDMAEWVSIMTNKKVYGPYRPSKAGPNSKTVIGKKPIWGVVLQGARAAGVMMSIYKLMSLRNKARIKTALLKWKQAGIDAGNLAKLRAL